MEQNRELKKISKLYRKEPMVVIYSFCILIIFVPIFLIIIILSFLSEDKSGLVFNVTSLTLGFGVFAIIGVLLYYVERKWYRKDLSSSTGESKSGGVEITETNVHMRNIYLTIMVPFLILMVIASIYAGIKYELIQALTGISIIWIITGPFAIWVYVKVARGTKKQRRFFVSDEIIKILIPPRPLFQVQWSNIDKIEVKLQPYLKVRYKGLPKKYLDIHELHFIGKNYHETYKILKGRDFNFKFLEIFSLLEIYAVKLKKEFIGLYY